MAVRNLPQWPLVVLQTFMNLTVFFVINRHKNSAMFFLSVPTTKRQCNESTASQSVWFCRRWAAAAPRGHLHSGPCDLRMTCCRLNPVGPELGTDSQTVAPGLPCPPLISSPGFPPLGVSPTNWAATRLPP